MCIWLAPLAILENFTVESVDWFQYKPDLKFPVFVHVIIAGIAWVGNIMSWVEGLQYTSTVRASLFANLHPLMLVVVLSCTGVKVSYLEWLGVLVVIVGIFVSAAHGLLSIFGPNQSSHAIRMLFGDALCSIAAVCEVCVILNRTKIKKYVPLMQVSIINHFFSYIN